MTRKLFLVMLFFAFSLHGASLSQQIKSSLIPYENFPEQGIIFRDISPVIENSELFSEIIDNFYERYKTKEIDAVVALEARGFIFGSVLAYKLKVPLVMVRKEGKLPGEIYRVSYKKLYGEGAFILRKDALKAGQQVIIIDDFYSTGGSLEAAVKLVQTAGTTVYEACFLINNTKASNKKIFPFPIYTLTEL
ncbi:MAG: adenine phosphoribosyltransferase [Parachlamydiaceae bacterium]